ncbi:MAG: MATE family efflux transporter [Flavobacteriales bacterium]|nr:MATE family efflux transporter [Flavobacteriales bacterium]
MNAILNKYLSRTNARSAKAVKNIFSSFAIKGVSIGVNLALVPLTIDYLGETKYGIWLTIGSMLGWINFFDVGLGHGLRNKLAESFAHGNMDKAQTYVSTAYISISALSLAVFGVFAITNQFIDWNVLLNIPPDITIGEDLGTITLAVFLMFSVQFVLQLINSIFLGNQQPAKVSFNAMVGNLFILAGVFVLMKYYDASLFYIALLSSGVPVLVLAGVNIYNYTHGFKAFYPRFGSFDFSSLKDVLNLGVKFFLIQISLLVFIGTTPFLISNFLSPKLVVPFNIAFRYFGVLTMVFSIIMSPFWSAYTEAYAKRDIVWIQRSIKRLVRLWLLFVGAAVLMLALSNWVYALWVKDVEVDFSISLCMMIYVVLNAFGNIYIMFLNGVGAVRMQMITGLVGMVIFFPLSYLFSVVMDLGVAGIVIATTICSLYGPLIAPFQVKKILNKAEETPADKI